VLLDSYGRAYGYDLAVGVQRASVAPRLQGAVDAGSRRVGGGGEALSLAFTVANASRGATNWPVQLQLTRHDAEAAQVLAARVAMKIAPGRQIGFAFRERADGLVAQLQGQDKPAFLIASDAGGDAGFAQSGNASFAVRQQIGPWGLTASAESGEAWLGSLRVADGMLGRQRETKGLHSLSVATDRNFGNLETALGMSWLAEDRTVLGGYFSDAFGAGGADTMFLDASAGWRFAQGWRLGGAVRQGWTRAERNGAIGAGSDFVSRAWSADLVKQGVLSRFDTLGLRVSQPLRVASGGLALTLPVDYDYASLTPTYATRYFSLSPTGRELNGEIAWAGRVLGGDAGASLYYRKDPGHVAQLPDDKGVAVRWSKGF
jgi:hypothetical protein